jgi:hypothetical protein
VMIWILRKATTSINKMNVKDDSDIYIFRYWDNFNSSRAQDALDYIEKNLQQNFKKNKVMDSDQIYKIHELKILESPYLVTEIQNNIIKIFSFCEIQEWRLGIPISQIICWGEGSGGSSKLTSYATWWTRMEK